MGKLFRRLRFWIRSRKGDAEPAEELMALGLLGAVGASRLIVRYLYGLSPLDVVSYGAVVALLLLAGAAATIVPAWRASRIDPTIALRWD